jgi:ubiquinone biosynthesis protein UbiJ
MRPSTDQPPAWCARQVTQPRELIPLLRAAGLAGLLSKLLFSKTPVFSSVAEFVEKVLSLEFRHPGLTADLLVQMRCVGWVGCCAGAGR